jgi:ABC-type iron transport system FetAB permease component
VQLLLIGYVLVFIFETDNWLVIVGVLTVMLVASSWISTRTLRRHDHVVRLVRDIRCLLPEPATPPRYRLGDRQL